MARPHHLKDRARRLRRDATEAEKRLWARLRSRQLAGAKFRRQVQIGNYIADFLCFEHQLIIELDGGQHSPESDAGRSAWLEAQGFRLLRFWNNDVMENVEGVLQAIQQELQCP